LIDWDVLFGPQWGVLNISRTKSDYSMGLITEVESLEGIMVHMSRHSEGNGIA